VLCTLVSIALLLVLNQARSFKWHTDPRWCLVAWSPVSRMNTNRWPALFKNTEDRLSRRQQVRSFHTVSKARNTVSQTERENLHSTLLNWWWVFWADCLVESDSAFRLLELKENLQHWTYWRNWPNCSCWLTYQMLCVKFVNDMCVVGTVYIKFLFTMVLCNRSVYWIIFQILLNKTPAVPGLCMNL